MEEADKANDITFGDIGNVRAGDVASEQLWAADHDALAKKIEAEKEGILRARRGGYQQPGSDFHRNSTSLATSPQSSYPSSILSPMGDIGLQHLTLRQFPSLGLNSQLPSSLNSRPSSHLGDYRMPELSNTVDQSFSPIQTSNITATRHSLVHPGAREKSTVERSILPRQIHQPATSTQLLQRMEMDRLVQIQQQEFIAQNNQLAPEELQRFLVRYHDHFIRVAASKVSQMFNGGVPGTSRSPPVNNFDTVPVASEPMRSGARPPPKEMKSVTEIESGLQATYISKPTKRVLPTMKDKDLEVVLRMHLKQLDGTLPYRDDFYCVTYASRHGDEKRVDLRNEDMYEELGTYVGAVLDNSAAANHRAGSKDRVQRRKRERTRKNTDKRATNSKNTKASSNLKTLTHVLGTIQAWNPKARRRVMDMTPGASIEKSNSKPMNRITGEYRAREHRLMCDDERILVRAAVEDGYDLLGKLQDVTRKHANHDVGDILNRLVDTLHLSPSNKEELEDAFSSFESTRFFVRMCVFEKGKRYIARMLSVLPPRLAVRIVTAIFENLSVLLYEIAPSSDEDSHDVLWAAIISTVRKHEFPPQRCMDVLTAFCRTHSSDSGAIIFSLTTSVGAKLLYVTMQRIFTAQAEDPPLYLTSGNLEWDALCTALTDRLGDAFDAAESSDNVWEVAAMLDALSTGTTQDGLRSTLKGLIDTGRAPPPPQT